MTDDTIDRDAIEERIEWYEHYMAIPASSLAADYALRSHSDEGEVTAAMEMAFKKRKEEIADALIKGDL